MHRTVATKDGGIDIEITPEEEQSILAEWEANEIERQEEEDRKNEEEQRKENLRRSLKLKLILSDQEIELLLSGK